MIKSVIFDFGGVLIRLKTISEVRQWLSEHNKKDDDIISSMLLNPGGSDLFWKVMRGKTSEAELWDFISEYWAMPLEEVKQEIKKFTAPEDLNYEMIDFLQSLKTKYKVGILSNAGDATLEMLNQYFPFKKVADHITISAEVGYAKPEREIYEICLQKMQVEAEESIFIDDLGENILAANQLGIKGVVHRENLDTIAQVRRLLTESV